MKPWGEEHEILSRGYSNFQNKVYTATSIIQHVTTLGDARHYPHYAISANLGINLGTRNQSVTTRSENQNTGLTMGSRTQDSGLKLSSSIGKYLTKYRRVHPTYM